MHSGEYRHEREETKRERERKQIAHGDSIDVGVSSPSSCMRDFCVGNPFRGCGWKLPPRADALCFGRVYITCGVWRVRPFSFFIITYSYLINSAFQLENLHGTRKRSNDRWYFEHNKLIHEERENNHCREL